MKCLFFFPPIPLPSVLRVCLLRSFGATIGRGVVIRSRVNITYPWKLAIGDHVWLGEEVVILSLAQVTIESNVCISQRAFICTGSHAFRSPSFDLITKPITIRAGSWIAAQAFVAPGVTIGPDSMVAAGAVVIRDVAPGTVVSGNPAAKREDNRTIRGGGNAV
jgi:putative colanic acid biosynthesis acetyltransferase WcaF